MKKLQKFCAALLLVSTLSLSAFAGQIEIGVAPPAASAQGEMSTTVNGEIQNGVAGDMPNGSSVAADVLGLVLGALSLL